MSPRLAEPRIVVGLTEREVEAIRASRMWTATVAGAAETVSVLDGLLRRLEQLHNNHPAPLGAGQEES